MTAYNNPEFDIIAGLSRCYVACKAGGIVLPHVIDIHLLSGRCNLDCRWCIGRTQRGKITPLSAIGDDEEILRILGKILDPRWPQTWPSEFHFCGCDSEPLLSSAFLPAIQFLIQRRRIIEIVTNGLLLDQEVIICAIANIKKINISLDVTNDQDYLNYKLPQGSQDIKGYSRVLDNIKRISTYRQKYNSSFFIAVNFVATPKTYNKEAWHNCFEELKFLGVNQIKVRDDLNRTFGGSIPGLQSDIEHLANKISGISILFNSTRQPHSDFKYCRAPRLWPALGADGCLYPCAHTASSKYRPFGSLVRMDSLLDLYQTLFHAPNNNFLAVDDIGCTRSCPSLIENYNEPSLAKTRLKHEMYL